MEPSAFSNTCPRHRRRWQTEAINGGWGNLWLMIELIVCQSAPDKLSCPQLCIPGCPVALCSWIKISLWFSFKTDNSGMIAGCESNSQQFLQAPRLAYKTWMHRCCFFHIKTKLRFKVYFWLWKRWQNNLFYKVCSVAFLELSIISRSRCTLFVPFGKFVLDSVLQFNNKLPKQRVTRHNKTSSTHHKTIIFSSSHLSQQMGFAKLLWKCKGLQRYSVYLP